ncbi:hypothetical protein ABTX81_30240 [Kitasatospora sp. NPDC097605]|uniref:zinc finger domain-containing protein n=1 Tax=Kitasatospora sp. NPDC097605 TaxID=3157226 RepID=UPI00332EECC9
MTTTPQTSTDPADTAHLRTGRRITVEEIALHLSGVSVLLRQLAYAAETVAEPVELEASIEEWRRTAERITGDAARFQRLTAITAGDVPLAVTFPNDGAAWGAAAADSDRRTYGGPTIVPTHQQLELLAGRAEAPANPFIARRHGDVETTTFPEAMAGVRFVESRAASARRAQERARAIDAEVLAIECTSPKCGAAEGGPCRTSTGRAAEVPHKVRLAEATRRVDERLDTLGPTITVNRHV